MRSIKPMNRYLVMMLHDVTQHDYRVMFERDFNGMLTVAFFRGDCMESEHHEHIGIPGMAPERLDEKVVECLERFVGSGLEPKP